MARIIVVYNPGSGSSDTATLKQAFTRAGASPEYLAVTTRELDKTLDKARSSSSTIVVAAGGDGTINTVARQLMGADCKLGIIPTGTLNHFAKALAIPLDLNQAVRTILAGKTRQVDVGLVNDTIFMNNSSIGFYPRSLRFREEYQHRIGKWPAAILGVMRTILRPRHYYVDVQIDGTTKSFRTPFVFVGNNPYDRSGPEIGERPALDTGQLALYVVKATRPLAIINSLLHTFLTKKRHTHDFAIYSASSFTIHTRKHQKIRVACDGELFVLRSPLAYSSAHASLRVIIPKGV